jgi:mono/diheme cytochrome c family protein
LSLAFLLAMMAPQVFAGDAKAGKRLAQLHCAICHIVESNEHNEIAEAPPFTVIGRKFECNLDALALALIAPHAKMNFDLKPPEASDVAEYIGTLDLSAPRARSCRSRSLHHLHC